MKWLRTKVRLVVLVLVALSTATWIFSSVELHWLARSTTKTTMYKSQGNCSYLYSRQNETTRRFHLCKTFVGRLGNHMFQYASLYGIARSKAMMPMIEADDVINDIFDIWAFKTKRKPACAGMKRHSETRGSAFDRDTVSFPNDKDIRLEGYLQSFLYFNRYEHELRCQFQFSPDVIEKAKQVLHNQVKALPKAVSTGATLVAVHVRRGDRLAAHSIALGQTFASKEYIRKAQDYFKQKYNRVVFVVCSDSIEWCAENIPGVDTIFIQGQSAVEDLAVMSQCQHAILTVGTFGWWMAWLVNGDTVYYGRRFEPNSKLASQWNMSHHYPPNWIPMV
ncbi:galactoside alpha-(1,2)-fucosyltransferase 2-like [Liolophura sinensis]|uniref:galactoside alpha-(1,2)-fucosyltransferase 2-like n=1 Tax=Liolophura sinensis TaxID=3198878 RepID=UPI003158E225